MSPGGAAKRPVVVMVHVVDGMGDPSGTEIRKFAEQLATAGDLVFTPHYFDTNDGSDSLPIAALLALRGFRTAWNSSSARCAASCRTG